MHELKQSTDEPVRSTRTVSSPWSEASPDAAKSHWRSHPNVERSTSDELRQHGSAEDSIGVYCAGALGTAVAGGLYPLAVAIVVGAISLLSGRMNGLGQIGEMAGVLLIGFIIGFVIAGLTAFCVFPLVAFVQWVAGLHRWRAVLVSCAGGWCGFASVAAIAHDSPSPGALVFAFGAMLLGQIGAGWPARWAANRQAWGSRPYQPSGAGRLPLRRLFGITTAVAVVAAVLAALPITRATYVAMVVAAIAQAVLVACYLLVRRELRSVPVDPVSLAPADDVSRETTAAANPT